MAVLSLPECKRYLVFQRRAIIVRAAAAMLDAKLCSLNHAARTLDVAPSWLCPMLRRFRDGGAAALVPLLPGKSTRLATACRLTFFIKT